MSKLNRDLNDPHPTAIAAAHLLAFRSKSYHEQVHHNELDKFHHLFVDFRGINLMK